MRFYLVTDASTTVPPKRIIVLKKPVVLASTSNPVPTDSSPVPPVVRKTIAKSVFTPAQHSTVAGHDIVSRASLSASAQTKSLSRPSNIKPTSVSSSASSVGHAEEDWLELLIELDVVDHARFNKFLDSVKAGQRVARQLHCGKAQLNAPDLIHIKIGDRTATVLADTKSLGKSGSGIFFHYQIMVMGFVFAVTRPFGRDLDRAKLWVQIAGSPSLRFGALTCYGVVRDVMSTIGLREKSVHIMRVDICADMFDIPIRPILDSIRNGNCVRLAKGDLLPYARNSYSLGGKVAKIIIYNKLKEAKCSPDKLALLRQRRWSGRNPTSVTRVEFQLRSRFLRDRGVRTIDDYIKRRADLIDYLTHKWFRITSTASTRGNTSRSKTSEIWSAVQSTFAELAGTPAGIPLKPNPVSWTTMRKPTPQLLGYLLTHALIDNRRIESPEVLKQYATEVFTRAIEDDPVGVMQKLHQKRLAWEADGRIAAS